MGRAGMGVSELVGECGIEMLAASSLVSALDSSYIFYDERTG